MWNTRLAFAVAVLVAAVAFTVLAFDVDVTVNGQPGPGLFPRTLGIAMIVLGAVDLTREVAALRGRPHRRDPSAAGDAPVPPGGPDGPLTPSGTEPAGGAGANPAGAVEPSAAPAGGAGSSAGPDSPAGGAVDRQPTHAATVVYVAGLTAALILLFPRLGAVVAVVAFGAASALVIRRRHGWLRPALVVVVTSVALVLLTRIVLRQDLPSGVLEGVPFLG